MRRGLNRVFVRAQLGSLVAQACDYTRAACSSAVRAVGMAVRLCSHAVRVQPRVGEVRVVERAVLRSRHPKMNAERPVLRSCYPKINVERAVLRSGRPFPFYVRGAQR